MSDEAFLARWSRRKRAADEAAPEAAPVAPQPASVAPKPEEERQTRVRRLRLPQSTFPRCRRSNRSPPKPTSAHSLRPVCLLN